MIAHLAFQLLQILLIILAVSTGQLVLVFLLAVPLVCTPPRPVPVCGLVQQVGEHTLHQVDPLDGGGHLGGHLDLQVWFLRWWIEYLLDHLGDFAVDRGYV